MTAKKGILLFAHGASDPEWAEPFERLREMIAGSVPEVAVALGFLERMTPDLVQAADQLAFCGSAEIHIFPLFLARGGHLKQDLPSLCDSVRNRYPEMQIRLHASLGESAAVREAVRQWIIADLNLPTKLC
jgi:sirohydrochlorin cobaltochelatase